MINPFFLAYIIIFKLKRLFSEFFFHLQSSLNFVISKVMAKKSSIKYVRCIRRSTSFSGLIFGFEVFKSQCCSVYQFIVERRSENLLVKSFKLDYFTDDPLLCFIVNGII